MRFAIVLGTRPEIIKMAPVIRACESLKVPFFVIHTGQHYSVNMDRVFFEELELAQPAYNLSIGGLPYHLQMSTMVREIADIVRKEHADVVIVQGDTNSVLAGALAAKNAGVSVAHHEAGLRSHDTTMPEEVNRIITDQISDFLFAPTQAALENLKEEGMQAKLMLLSGNTIVDSVQQNIIIAGRKSRIMETLKLKPKEHFLVTAHRAENVDKPERLQGILGGLRLLGQQYPGARIIFPIHPRTKKRMEEFGIAAPEGVEFLEPLGYLDFLTLIKNAKALITDSGGLQEEASILRVPCVTVRDNTERPETISAGINVLAGTDEQRIADGVARMVSQHHDWPMLFGDGKAGERIVGALKAHLTERKP